MFFYRIAEPNEALIVSGARATKDGATDYKIVVGHGVWVMPVFRKARTLGLRAHQVEVVENCVTTQGVPVIIQGVVVFKVGSDPASIANAAQRFMENEDDMDAKAQNVFAGHLRAIIGEMTVEEIIRDRQKLASTVREASSGEMQLLGLTVDSFLIQKFDDPTKYIEQLAAPHQAAVRKDARIAEAERDQEATAKEQAVAASNAEATAVSEVKQAQLAAQAEVARATAEQAGPRATAEAMMAVVEQQTKVAELEAVQTQKRLIVEQIRPAEAASEAKIAEAEGEKRSLILSAEGEAEQTKVRAVADAEKERSVGEAKADARKAFLLAEAEGLQARAEALAANQEAVVNQQIAEQLPAIVAEAAKVFQGIDSLTVLDGAKGMSGFLSEVLGVATTVMPTLRAAFKNGTEQNGDHPASSESRASRAGRT